MVKLFSPYGLLLVMQLLWPFYFDFIPKESLFFSWLAISLALFHRSFPSWLMIVFVPISIIWASYSYGTFFDPEAATHFLFLLLFLKLLEIREQRDYFSFLLISLLLLCSACLFMEGIEQFFLAIFHLFLLFLIWFLGHKKHFKNVHFLRHELKPAIFAFFSALPMTFFLFVFFPRFQGGFINLSKTSQAKIGHNKDVRIDSISRLVPSDEVVLRVESSSALLSHLSYWRGNVLTHTDGFNWYYRDRKSIQEPLFKKKQGGEAYQVEVVKRVAAEIFTLEDTVDLQVPGSSFFYNREGQVAWLEKKRVLNRYRGVRTSFSHDDRPKSFDSYLQVSGEASEKVKQLLARLGDKPKSFIRSMEDFFQKQNFIYSLQPGRQTHLEQFLFDARKGFCSHFASSLAILARRKGIPSRLVTGFLGVEKNNLGNYYVVRDNDAHVWVELYDKKKNSWLRVDPTGFVEAERISRGGSQFFYQQSQDGFIHKMMNVFQLEKQYNYFRQWLDTLNRQWFQLMLGMDNQIQKKIANKLKVNMKIFYTLSFWGIMFCWIFLLVLGNYFLKRSRKQKDRALIIKNKFYKRMQKNGLIISRSDPLLLVEKKIKNHFGVHSKELQLWKQLLSYQYQKSSHVDLKTLKDLWSAL